MCKLSSYFLLIFVLSLTMIQKCHGVMDVPLQDNIVTAVFTPFDEHENINYPVIPKMAQYYKEKNIKAIIVADYFAQGASIPLAERKRLAKAWEEQANCHGFDLIIEIGAIPYVDTLEMARYCTTLNVTAITTFPEITYQASTLSEALEDLQRICDATGNKLPLLYNELNVIEQNIKTDEVYLGAIDGCVSCFVGVITNMITFHDIKAAVPSIAGYQLWDYGTGAIAASLSTGMNLSENVNLFPDLAFKIRDAVKNCELKKAADLQQQLNRRMYAITTNIGATVVQRRRTYVEQETAAFQLLSGIDVGYRYPLERPNSTVINRMRSRLEALEVKLYCGSENKH